MKILELFAWSRSIWKVADGLWYYTYSTDLYEFEWINKACDILDFDYRNIWFIPDIIWASCPCTTYSIASCWTHRNKDYSAKTEEAKIWDLIVLKTLEIIKYFEKLNPNLKWYIENPRGILRKMDFMKYLPIRKTITYCSYWDIRMKPTDIWTNNKNWEPKPMCHNYKYDKDWNVINKHCHHESARRGARTWTQGLKWDYERSKIPYELCKEILLISNK